MFGISGDYVVYPTVCLVYLGIMLCILQYVWYILGLCCVSYSMFGISRDYVVYPTVCVFNIYIILLKVC